MTKTISYKKLWKLLIDRNMSRSQLREVTGVSTASIAKLGNNWCTCQNLRRFAVWFDWYHGAGWRGITLVAPFPLYHGKQCPWIAIRLPALLVEGIPQAPINAGFHPAATRSLNAISIQDFLTVHDKQRRSSYISVWPLVMVRKF